MYNPTISSLEMDRKDYLSVIVEVNDVNDPPVFASQETDLVVTEVCVCAAFPE